MPGRATRFYIAFGGREPSQWVSHEIMLDSSQPDSRVPEGFAPPGSREDPDPLCVGELTTASRSIYGGRNTWPLTRAGLRLVTREHMVSRQERELREKAARGEIDARRPHEQPLRLRGNSAQLLVSLLVGLANTSHNLTNSRFDSIWATGRFEEGPLGGGFARVNAVTGKLEAFRNHVQEHPHDHHLFVAPYSCYKELRQFVQENENAVLWEFDDHSDPFPDLSDAHHVLIIALHHGMTHFRALLDACRVHDKQRPPLVELPDEQPRALERPRLSSPKNQANVSARGLTLRWNEVADASGYQIIVSTQKEELLEVNQTSHMASNEIILNELVEETSFTLTGKQLVPYKQYFWAVRARCPGRSGNRSPCWSFVTRPHEEIEPPMADLAFAPTRDMTSITRPEAQGAAQIDQGQALVTQKEVINERYELIGELGEGGFARVYRAIDKQLGREVAVKILRAEWLTDDKMREAFTSRFKREAQTVANLEHPHIVPIYDSGVIDQNTFERPFLVMKMLAGEDMDALLSKGPLDAKRLLEVGTQTLDALSYVHELGIVHKDLKPDNLFVTTDYRGHEHIYVMDFGIVYDPRDGAPRLTQTGQFAGTVQYMSPEYLLHQSVAPCLDVYQMGLILIELFTGLPLISRDTTMQKLIGRYIQKEAVELPVLLQGSGAGHVLERAIAFEAQDRYPDARAFLEAWSNLTVSDFPQGVPQLDLGERRGGLDSDAFFPAETGPTRELPDVLRVEGAARGEATPERQAPPRQQRANIPAAATDPINAPDKKPFKTPVLVGLSVLVILGICAASAVILMLVDKKDKSDNQRMTTASTETSAATQTSASTTPTRPTETTPEQRSTRIAIKSSPSGATVLVDGKRVGETPLEHTHESSEASFEVIVKADGFKVVKQRGEAGKPFALVVDLEPKKKASAKTRRPAQRTPTKKTAQQKPKSSKENTAKTNGEVKQKEASAIEVASDAAPKSQTNPATKPAKEEKERTSIVLPPDY